MSDDLEIMALLHQADDACKPLDLAIEKEHAVFRAIQSLISCNRLLRERISKLEKTTTIDFDSLAIDVDPAS